MSDLSALLQLITSGVHAIENIHSTHGATIPSLDEPFQPPSFQDDALIPQIGLVVTACTQLMATLIPPPLQLFSAAGSMYTPACLATVIDANVVEILREAGPNGLHIRDIGEKSGTDPAKIGRVIRYLATRYVFKEVAPDVFANNRLSSCLDTRKPLDVLKANPEDKHVDTPGIAALIAHTSDECLKSSAYIAENLLDPATAHSQDPLTSPFSRAHGGGKLIGAWQWFEQPGNEARLKRFGAAMHGTSLLFPPDTVVAAYDWGSLKDNDLIVDVGGGIGAATVVLAKAYPKLRFVIQDRPSVVPEGIKFFQSKLPEALTENRVKFEAHDFFIRQPIKDAKIFLMRFITHDWPDPTVKIILKHLRAAAQPTTVLVVLDPIVPYAGPTGDEHTNIVGAQPPPLPAPLLPGLGLASTLVTMADIQMMNALNSQERTVGQFKAMVDGTGWKLDYIKPTPMLSTLVFVPV